MAIGSAGTMSIEDLEAVPDRLLGVREELNLLTYGPSTVLVARDDDDAILGAVRFALRDDAHRHHALIADLQVDPDHRDAGIEEALIQAAEARLRAVDVHKVDALVPDGVGWSRYFYRLGYWASRKTVVMEWDLRQLAAPSDRSDCAIELVERPAAAEVGGFILESYQPYWRWWREHRVDRRWLRVEFPAVHEPLESAELEREMTERVRAYVSRLGDDPAQVVFLARAGGRLVGLCDAIDRADGDQLALGVLVLRDFGGKQLGSALLGRALHWLKTRGHQTARVTTTSGLDDYDPTVYLYNLSYGAQMRGEFVDLVKHTALDQPASVTTADH